MDGYAIHFGRYATCAKGAGDEAISESTICMGLSPADGSSFKSITLRAIAVFSHPLTPYI